MFSRSPDSGHPVELVEPVVHDDSPPNTAPQEQGTDASRVLDDGGPEQSSPPASGSLSSEPSHDAGQMGQEAQSSVDEPEDDPLPTDHESLLALELENEKGRWIGDGKPSWVGMETDEWHLTNWSGYRNYHCKWPGCQFTAIESKPAGTVTRPDAVTVIEDHYRYHRASDQVYTESMNEARRLSLRRQGFVDERGNPL